MQLWQKACLLGGSSSNVLRLSLAMKYSGNVTHQLMHQEMPAVFLNRGLDTLITYGEAAGWQ